MDDAIYELTEIAERHELKLETVVAIRQTLALEAIADRLESVEKLMDTWALG